MSLIMYLLQVSACTGIFFVFYKLVLSRFTFFTINRWYLLATLLISFAIPAITIPAGAPQPLPVFQKAVFYQEPIVEYVPVAVQQKEIAVEKPFDWQSYLPLAYMIAALALALKLAISVLLFFIRIRGKQVVQLGAVKVIKGDTRFKNGSFLNYVFLDEQELSRAEVEQVLAHEMVHIKLLHSIDRLFARMVQIVLWFNPFSYLYLKAVTENHEFETDRAVTLGTDKSAYADLLLRLSISPNHALYSHFSMIPLKKRITMLFTNPTKKMKKIFYLLVLPLVAISCLAFAKRDLINAIVPNGSAKSKIKNSFTVYRNAVKPVPRNQLNAGSSNLERKAGFTKDTSTLEELSAVSGVTELGKQLVVLIDDKVFDRSILFKISPSCIKGSSIFNKSWSLEHYGPKAADGVVKISTKAGNITYLTKLEKENLQKEATAARAFYSRYTLVGEDGSTQQRVRLKGVGSHGLNANDKVGFVLGNKVFTEEQVDEFERELKASNVSGEHGVSGKENMVFSGLGLDLSMFDIVFYVKLDTNRIIKQGYRQKVKGRDPVADAARRAYFNSEDFKAKSALVKMVANRTFKAVVKGAYTSAAQKPAYSGMLVEVSGATYLLSSMAPDAAERRVIESLKKDDVLTVFSRHGGFTESVPYVLISPASIEKDGKVIYKRIEKPIEKTAFGYESNRGRYSDCKIISISKPVGNKVFMKAEKDGFTLNFQFDASQTKLSNLARFKAGDEIRIHFVHEVKTGPKSYFIKDWLALSKERRENAYDVRNDKLFFKFYEPVASNTSVQSDSLDVRDIQFGKTKLSSLTTDRTFTGKPVTMIENKSFRLIANEISFDAKSNTVKAKMGGGEKAMLLRSRQDAIVADSIKIDLTSGKYILFSSKKPAGKAFAYPAAQPKLLPAVNKVAVTPFIEDESRKFIARDLDLKSRMNTMLNSPNGRLIDVMLRAIAGGELTAYRSYNQYYPNLSSPISIAEADRLLSKTDVVTKFRIFENWVFNRKNLTWKPEILGIAPITESPKGPEPAFWISFANAHQVFSKSGAVNGASNATGLNLDDIFMKRIFASNIVLESKVVGRIGPPTDPQSPDKAKL